MTSWQRLIATCISKMAEEILKKVHFWMRLSKKVYIGLRLLCESTFNPFSARISMIFVLFVMDLTPCYLKLQYKVTHFWKDYELSFSKMFLLFIYKISACSSNSIFCVSFYEKGGKFEFPAFFSKFSAYIEKFYLLR